jgi:hypothetical protein
LEGTVVESNLIYHNSEGGIVAYWWASGKRHAARAVRNLLFANGAVDVHNNRPNEFDLILQDNLFADPQLCVDGLGSDGSVAEGSPALMQPWGAIGAVEKPGCGPADITLRENKTTWGAIQARHGP